MEHGPTVPCRLVAVIAVIAFALIAGCGGAQRPQPSAATIAAIEHAEAAERARDHEVARRRYYAAIDTAPDVASEVFARHQFAETLLSWGEIDAGEGQLARIVARAPDDAAAWHDLGLVRHNRGDDAGAITALERARDLARRDPRPRISLAVLYWKLGRLPSALVEYKALAELSLPERLRRRVEWAIACLEPGHQPEPKGCPHVKLAP